MGQGAPGRDLCGRRGKSMARVRKAPNGKRAFHLSIKGTLRKPKLDDNTRMPWPPEYFHPLPRFGLGPLSDAKGLP